jgi:tRNA G18 (ribose-2'-O)-methylase SpoU
MISDFEYLNSPEIRQKFEATNNLFVTEGRKIFDRSIELGYEPRAILTTSEWLADIDPDITSRFHLHVYSPAEISEIAGFPVHRGLIATFNRRPKQSVADVLSLDGPLVLLEGLTDLENVGTIFRTAAALGIAGVLLDATAPDPLFRRCLKASMGATLQLPFARYGKTSELLELKGNRRLIGLTPDAETTVGSKLAGGNEILGFGSEGSGLSVELLAACDEKLSIPMSNDVSSLNVAAAAAISIWEFQQRVRS